MWWRRISVSGLSRSVRKPLYDLEHKLCWSDSDFLLHCKEAILLFCRSVVWLFSYKRLVSTVEMLSYQSTLISDICSETQKLKQLRWKSISSQVTWIERDLVPKFLAPCVKGSWDICKNLTWGQRREQLLSS